MAYQFDDLVGASGWPLREVGAAMELLGDFIVTHRIGWTAFTKISAPRNHAPIFQVDFEDRRHLVISRFFRFGINTEMDAIDHRLDIGPVDDGVRELAESRLALNQQDSEAELHAELGLKVVLRVMVNERVGKVAIRSHFDHLHILSFDLLAADEPLHLGHSGMRQRATGVRLDGDAGVGERPGLAELVENGGGIVAATKSVEEAAVSFQYLFSARPAESRQVSGKDSDLGGMSGMERLHHRSKVFAQPAGLTGCDSEGAGELRFIEGAKFGAGSGAAKYSAGSGGMKPILIVAGRYCFCNLALDFHAQVIGHEKIPGAGGGGIGKGQSGGKHWDRGVGKQCVYAVLANRQLGVVKILDVDRQAIGEGRKARRQFGLCPHYGGSAIRKAEAGGIIAKQLSVLGSGAGQGQA